MISNTSIKMCAECEECIYQGNGICTCKRTNLIVIINDVPSEHHLICKRAQSPHTLNENNEVSNEQIRQQ